MGLNAMPAAVSAYMLFANEEGRSRAKDMLAEEGAGNAGGVAAVAKKVGALWASMPEAEKDAWREKAKENKAAMAKEAEAEGQDAKKEQKVKTAAPALPTSTVRRIVARDPGGKRIGRDAVAAVALATELVLESITHASVRMATANGRRGVRLDDVLDSIAAQRGASCGYLFLHENAGHIKRVVAALAAKRAENAAAKRKRAVETEATEADGEGQGNEDAAQAEEEEEAEAEAEEEAEEEDAVAEEEEDAMAEEAEDEASPDADDGEGL